MKRSLAIPLSGGFGFLVILRAAVYYAGVDSLALSITLVMGAALLLGVCELYWISARTRTLRAELGSLPSPATLDHVLRASPLLSSLLRARLSQSNLVVPGPVFAPFIVGLLVMLGLLGTFLGLFETLRGAGQALTASADVDALRAGLKAPISGLMRGFGTSAAGVASSALLGLCAVFVRRDNARLSQELHATVSGPLALYSSAQRQLTALENVAQQGDALPRAAVALGEVVAALERLEGSFARSQQDAMQSGRKAVESATAELRAELREVARASQAFAQDSALALSALKTDWARAHELAAEQTQAALRQAFAEVGAAVVAGVGRAAEASSTAVAPLLERGIAETTRALHDHLTELRTAAIRDATELGERLNAQASDLQARLEAHALALQAGEDTRAAVLAGQWQALAGAAERQIEQAAERDRQRAGALADAAAQLEARLDHGAQSEQRRARDAETLIARITQASEAIGAAAADQLAGLQRFIETEGARLKASEALAEQRQGQLFQRLTELSEAQAQRLAEFERQLLLRHETSGEQLRDRLAEHHDALGQDLQRTSKLVAEGASLLQSSGAEFGAVVESFAAAVERQREGARSWLESLGEMERAVANAGESAAADVLDQHLVRTHELFDRQLQFHQELIEQLRGSRRDSMVVDAAG
jgi:hypothetical protein